MGNAQFYWGMFTMLLLEGFGYFIYIKVREARERRAMRDKIIPPSGSGLDDTRRR